jgi:hypothetical protein
MHCRRQRAFHNALMAVVRRVDARLFPKIHPSPAAAFTPRRAAVKA